MKVSESALTVAIIRALNELHGVWVYRQNTGALPDRTGRVVRYGYPGAPDITGLIIDAQGDPARRLDVEVKLPGGMLSDPQQKYRDRVMALGGLYIVAVSVEDATAEVRRWL